MTRLAQLFGGWKACLERVADAKKRARTKRASGTRRAPRRRRRQKRRRQKAKRQDEDERESMIPLLNRGRTRCARADAQPCAGMPWHLREGRRNAESARATGLTKRTASWNHAWPKKARGGTLNTTTSCRNRQMSCSTARTFSPPRRGCDDEGDGHEERTTKMATKNTTRGSKRCRQAHNSFHLVFTLRLQALRRS